MQPACPHTFTERKEQLLLPKGLGSSLDLSLSSAVGGGPRGLRAAGREDTGQRCDQHQAHPRGSLQRRDPVYDRWRATDNSTLGDDDSFPH